MLSNALDNECTGRSPCRECPWHLQGLDKNQCVNKCERLAAYRDGESWEGLAIPICERGGKEIAMIKDEHPTSNIKHRISNEEKKNNQQSKVCVICHDPDKKVLNKRSQTCAACYQAWNVGKIDHPTLGHFKPSLTKSKIKTNPSEKKLKTANESMLKSMADAITKEVIAEIMAEKVTKAAGLSLNFDNYPRIKKQIDFLADKYLVNAEHVIIGLLGEALAGRKQTSQSYAGQEEEINE